ncbi:hypothetical protein GCM10009789_41360 [Kribbella sancticallisti]|uniref:Conjugal transfer protein TraB n=1 Tax=Kribbella sancticallisti TaxID=460087 RepID=A0ABN2DQ94_9ACTN
MQIIENSIVGTRSAVLRVRRRGSGLEFVIFPMLHVAMPSFYAEVTRRLRECDLIVVEGVDGESVAGSLLTMTYQVIPLDTDSGLVEDNIPYADLGIPLITPDLTGEEFDQGVQQLSLKTRVLMFGVAPIAAAAMNLFNARERLLLSRDIEVNDLPTAAEELESDEMGSFRGLLLGRRDELVVAALTDLVDERSTEDLQVAVVYGAAHVPGILTGLGKLDYRVVGADWITVVAA